MLNPKPILVFSTPQVLKTPELVLGLVFLAHLVVETTLIPIHKSVVTLL
jgi:hypothetical protein